MKIIHLTLKKKWFDMVVSGEKKEEYRDIKPYWTKRLTNIRDHAFNVKFKHGYGVNAPSVYIEGVEITLGEGRKEWGAEPGTKYFVIKLGNIINVHNL